MSMTITEMIDRMRDLKYEQMELSQQLTSEVMKIDGIREAIKSGLVKPNFPTPSGFIRSLRMNKMNRK